MQNIDKQSTKVTMSMEDYEFLNSYKKSYENLIKDLKGLTYIDSMTTDEIVVVIKRKSAEDLIAPFAGRDCELEMYPEGVKVIWKE